MFYLLIVERKKKKEMARELFSQGGTCLVGCARFPQC
jgi:hypothetical protein